MNEDLDAEVRALLHARRGDWQTVANEAGVSYSWVSKFVNGRIENPGFATLKRLRAYLTGATAAAAEPAVQLASEAPAAALTQIDVDRVICGAARPAYAPRTGADRRSDSPSNHRERGGR